MNDKCLPKPPRSFQTFGWFHANTADFVCHSEPAFRQAKNPGWGWLFSFPRSSWERSMERSRVRGIVSISVEVPPISPGMTSSNPITHLFRPGGPDRMRRGGHHRDEKKGNISILFGINRIASQECHTFLRKSEQNSSIFAD
jgi:hypothetical protein